VLTLLALLCSTRAITAADDLDALEQQAFRAAVDRVGPSVVRIETLGGLERVDQLLMGTGPTTGLALTADGYIISSAFNFVQHPASILVQLPDGSRRPARLVATDHNRMIVLLKLEPERPLAVPEIADEAGIRVGQWAIAVGRTFEGNRPNMAVGIVSALGRIWGKALQTDAAVSPNNYGGPLVDIRGRVLGVLVPLSPQGNSESAGVEWYDSGIGFAIPAEAIQKLLPRLKEGKDLYPGLAGILLAEKGVFTGEPVLEGVRPRSPASRAGLKKGDRVVEIDGSKIALTADLKREFARHYAGDKMHLVVLRDDKRIEHDIALLEKLEAYETPFLGILPRRDSPKSEVLEGLMKVFGLGGGEEKKPAEKPDPGPSAKPGAKKTLAIKTPQKKPTVVRVRYVYPGSPAAAAGIRPGDVISRFDGAPVKDVDELRGELAGHAPDESLSIRFRHGTTTTDRELKLAAMPEGVPAADLPPARDPVKPSEGKRPKVGIVPLKAEDAANEAHAYVPEGYDPAVPHGLVIWLDGADGPEIKDLVARWKPLCDRHDLILLVPKGADPARWQSHDKTVVQELVVMVAEQYTIDRTRVVVCGRPSSARLCSDLAFGARHAIHGLVLFDAAPSGKPADNEPATPLAVYLARAAKSPRAEAIAAGVEQLRRAKYPVTIKDLGPDPRELSAEELAELARWIDALDRL
jgi:serine protease Do